MRKLAIKSLLIIHTWQKKTGKQPSQDAMIFISNHWDNLMAVKYKDTEFYCERKLFASYFRCPRAPHIKIAQTQFFPGRTITYPKKTDKLDAWLVTTSPHCWPRWRTSFISCALFPTKPRSNFRILLNTVTQEHAHLKHLKSMCHL